LISIDMVNKVLINRFGDAGKSCHYDISNYFNKFYKKILLKQPSVLPGGRQIFVT